MNLFNFRSLSKQLFRTLVARHLRVSLLLVAGFGLILATIGGSVVTHSVANHQNIVSLKKANIEAASRLSAAKQLAQASQKATTEKGSASNNSTNPNPMTTSTQPTVPAKTGQPIKYSTSSDPRSTAYSLTPPAANPASFNIAITHAGQVSPGTLISNNATKGEREYYGGDLVLSPAVVTISKSGPNWINFMASIPDGQTANGPAEAWNDRSSTINVGSSTVLNAGSNWTMMALLNTYPTLPANGTYTVHLQTHRTAQTADGWEYDGFLTVKVVD